MAYNGPMSSADDTAANFAMMSAELLNGITFLLSNQPAPDHRQAEAQVGLLKKALRDQLALMGSMEPDRVEGPEAFDLPGLQSAARQLVELLDAWTDLGSAVPEEIRACALAVMRAMGFGAEQVAVFEG